MKQLNDANEGSFVRSDFQIKREGFIQNYIHQPNVLNQLGKLGIGQVHPIAHDNKRMVHYDYLNDIEVPDIQFEAPDKEVGLNATVATAILVQKGYNVRLSKDSLVTPFNGQARLPLIMRQISAKLAQADDIIFWNGDTNTGLKGVKTSGVAKSLTTTGAWGVASNGILTNVIADIAQANEYFDGLGLAEGAMSMIITTQLKKLLTHTIKTYGDSIAREYIMPMLNGGKVITSNNIQSAVVNDQYATSITSTQNTCIFVKHSVDAFDYFEGGFKFFRQPDGWFERWGIKHKFGHAFPLGDRFWAVIETISTATS